MPSGENSIQTRFSADNQPLTNGKPIGTRNRSTIARQILDMIAILPDATFEQLKEVIPDIERKMNAEQIMTLSVLSNAIKKGDGYLYAQLLDSAYGKPKSAIDIDHTSLGEKINFQPVIQANSPPLADSEK